MTKLYLFDLGNVVLTDDHPYHTSEQLKLFCEYFDLSLDGLETAFQKAFTNFSIGKTTEDDFWKEYLSMACAKK